MRLPRIQFGACALFGVLLAACGTTSQPAASAPTTISQPAATSAAPTTANATAEAATSAAVATAETPAETTAAAGIPEGRTPEGYHVLGNPDAPVTIQFYSDFF